MRENYSRSTGSGLEDPKQQRSAFELREERIVEGGAGEATMPPPGAAREGAGQSSDIPAMC